MTAPRCDQVRTQAEAKLAQIDARIADLQRLRNALASLAAACVHGGPTGECPLLDALEHEWQIDVDQYRQ